MSVERDEGETSSFINQKRSVVHPPPAAACHTVCRDGTRQAQSPASSTSSSRSKSSVSVVTSSPPHVFTIPSNTATTPFSNSLLNQNVIASSAEQRTHFYVPCFSSFAPPEDAQSMIQNYVFSADSSLPFWAQPNSYETSDYSGYPGEHEIPLSYKYEAQQIRGFAADPPGWIPPSSYCRNFQRSRKPIKQRRSRTDAAVQTDNSPPLFILQFSDDLVELESSTESFKAGRKNHLRHFSTHLVSFQDTTPAGPSYSDILSGKKKPIVTIEPERSQERTGAGEHSDCKELKNEDDGGDGGGRIPGLITAREVLASLATQRQEEKDKKKKKNKPTKQLNLVDFVLTPEKPTKASKEQDVAVSPQENLKKQAEKKTPNVPLGNILDSSSPVFHKGKTRENQRKKVTTTKKIILREKEMQKVGKDLVEEKEVEQSVPFSRNLARAPHSRKFREYCRNFVTPELNAAVIAFLQELARFQDRMHANDPVKAKLKKRMVCGLREVKKFVQVEKIKCVVVAPNIDSVTSTGGLDDQLGNILDACEEQNVPLIFALNKHKLGRTLYKKSPVSCVGILNYQGAEQFYREVVSHLETAQTDYKNSNGVPAVELLTDPTSLEIGKTHD